MKSNTRLKLAHRWPFLFSNGAHSFGFLTVVGLVLYGVMFTASTMQAHTYFDLSTHGGRTEAKVVAIDESHSRNSNLYRPVGLFTVDGKDFRHTFKNVNSNRGYWSVGDSLQVAYDKSNPNRAVVVGAEAEKDQQADRTRLTGFLVGVGIMFVGWSVCVGRNLYRLHHPKPVAVRRKRKKAKR
jgi:hypothetical protein